MSKLTLNTIKSKHKYYNNTFFAKWAALYDYEKYLLTPLRKKAAAFLNLKHSQKILDLATGTGAQAYQLALLGHDVTGIDLSPEMLAQAKKKVSQELKLTFRQADVTDLPFKTGKFDATSISFGLHDMPYEVGVKALEEMKRVTKKGGNLLIVDYTEPKKHLAAKAVFPIINIYETKNWRPFIERGLDSILNDVGLKARRTTHYLGLAQIVVVENM